MKTDREKLEALRREYLETEIPPELPGIVHAPFLKRKRSRLPQQMLCLAGLPVPDLRRRAEPESGLCGRGGAGPRDRRGGAGAHFFGVSRLHGP